MAVEVAMTAAVAIPAVGTTTATDAADRRDTRRSRTTDPEHRLAPKPPPREQLDPRARTLWRLSGLLGAIPIAIAAAAAAYVAIRYDLVSTWLAIVLAVAVAAVGAVGVWPYPDLLWRHWRYEIGEVEVDLQHGWWTVTRTLIPMSRIQHVDTRRGPLQRRFGLASVVLYTAAGASEIPALADHVAAATRDRVAALANANDDL